MIGRDVVVMVVTDRTQLASSGPGLVPVVGAALEGGATRVLLRDKDLPSEERRRLAVELRRLTAAVGAELVVGGDVDLAADTGADGVHLAAADPWPALGSASGAAVGLAVGRSCHDLDELRSARRHGAAWATFSPVFATPSKPGYGPALGSAGLAAGCRAAAPLPVLALGGVEAGRVRACLVAGASGVALMGAVMRADDPAAIVRAVIDETGRDETGRDETGEART